MKKRLIAVLMALVLALSVFPMTAIADDAPATPAPYIGYSAIGDSICAGFSQEEYKLDEIGFTMDNNVEKSPRTCYARLVGSAFGIDDMNDEDDGDSDLDDTTYNLGKCGCDSNELLQILNDPTYEEDGTNYYNLYKKYLSKSNLITLEIGSNDLIMSVADAILACVGDDGSVKLTHKEAMALVEMVLTGADIQEVIKSATGIEPSPEDMQQIQAVLSTDNLPLILNAAMAKFDENFPKILEIICSTYSTAQLVILNGYNPYPGDSDLSKMIQGYINAMNQMMEGYSSAAGLVLVDISDTPTNGMDPHPTTEGHAMIAAKIIDKLAITITASAEAGGTITPTGQLAVRDNSSKTYTIKANKGFEIRDVLVDGASVGAVDSYTFADVTTDHTIAASFRCVMHYDTYTALGDSITSGYALEKYEGDYSNPEDCYVHVAGDRLTVINNYNDAMIALTSEDMLDILKNPANKYHDLIVQNLSSSDLISIDIGSNDLSMTLFDILLECLGVKSPSDHYTVKERGEALAMLTEGTSLQSLLKTMTTEQIDKLLGMFKPSEESQTPEVVNRLTKAVEQFTVNWDQIIKTIREINPDAKLAAIGYYNPYPGFDFTLGNTRYGIGELLNRFIVPMNEYISHQSVEAGEYVYVSTYNGIQLNSTSHAQSNLLTSVPSSPPFDPMQLELFVDPHPTAAGHAEIAKRLLDALGNLNPGDPGYPYHPVYIPYYVVDAKASAGGTISPSGYNTVISGNQLLFTFTPNKGYIIESVLVDGKPVAVAPSYTTNFTDTSAHTIYVSFAKDTGVKGTKDVKNPFTDVGDSWYYDAVMSVYVNDIMSGTSSTLFEPDMTVTRAMLAKILYRMEKEPDVVYKALFPDVPQGEWYTNAVMWAANNDVITGYGNGKFGPNDALTREQMVTILYRFAKYKAYNTGAVNDLSSFTDASSISAWAGEAMKWAVAEGLISGTDLMHLSPLGSVSRASIAMLIYRFIEKYWD